MVYSLTAWKEPFRNQPKSDLFTNKQLNDYVKNELQCSSDIHLNIQQHSTKPIPKCKFPGSSIYESMISLISIWTQVGEAESFVNKFVTDLHVKYEYIHIKRGEECLEKLTPAINLLKQFIDSFQKSMNEIFPEQVAIEWLETYFMKRFRSINQRYEFILRAVKEQKSWLPRPIPNINKLDINQKT